MMRYYDAKMPTTTLYALPSDFNAISAYVTKDMNFGYHIEASRAGIDTIINARVQGGQYLQYAYNGDRVIACLQVTKNGNNYSYAVPKALGSELGDSSYTSYIFLK